MATTLSDVLFALCAVAIATAQWFILRSTRRGMTYAGAHEDAARPGPSRHAALEWLYAVVPALVLAALLVFTWRAMHPDTVDVRGISPPSIGMGA